MIDTNLYDTNRLLWAKTHPNAIIPTKDEENMGRDVYACFDEDYMVIPALTTKLIPTGIACAMSPQYGIRLRDRGSNGSKGIHVNAGSIDSGFRGTIFVAWDNTNNRDVILSKLPMEELIAKYGQYTNDSWGDLYIPTNPTLPCEPNDFSVEDNVTWIDEEDGYEPIIYPYQKAICQAEVVVVPVMKDEEVSYEELLTVPSKRGTGILGSSNK